MGTNNLRVEGQMTPSGPCPGVRLAASTSPLATLDSEVGKGGGRLLSADCALL